MPLHRFLDRLTRRSILTQEEQQAILSLPTEAEQVRSNHDFVRLGERLDHSCLVVAGMIGRFEQTCEGARQITAIHIPGDFVDLHSFLLKEMDHSVGALSHCRVLRFPHPRLADLTVKQPHLTRLLWLLTLIDSSIHREWLIAASRTAPEQLAHLICELYVRLGVTELITEGRFTLPVTQMELGEALGLSAVHVNRTLQQLRAEGLFSWQNQEIHILDWEALKRRGSFDPRYLHLVKEPR